MIDICKNIVYIICGVLIAQTFPCILGRCNKIMFIKYFERGIVWLTYYYGLVTLFKFCS